MCLIVVHLLEILRGYFYINVTLNYLILRVLLWRCKFCVGFIINAVYSFWLKRYLVDYVHVLLLKSLLLLCLL